MIASVAGGYDTLARGTRNLWSLQANHSLRARIGTVMPAIMRRRFELRDPRIFLRQRRALLVERVLQRLDALVALGGL